MNKPVTPNTLYRQWRWLPLSTLLIVFLNAAVEPPVRAAANDREQADKLLVVDCLLPGKVRKVGGVMTYLSARRPIKTTASDCEIRGGEHTSYDRANYATALKIWLPEAKSGDPKAQNYVGEIFEKGLGTESDYQAAAVWYRKAADQGYSPAQINLGQLYESGLGVKADMREALNWYRRASGLEDDDLEWASSVRVTLEAKDQQIQELEQRSEKSEAETAALRDQLSVAQSELSGRQKEIDLARSKRDEIAREMAQHDAAMQAATAAGQQQREQELNEKQAQLESRRKDLDQLAETLGTQASLLTEKQRETAENNTMLETRFLLKQAETERLRNRLQSLNEELTQARDELAEDSTQDMAMILSLQAVEAEQKSLQDELAVSTEQGRIYQAELDDARANLDEAASRYAQTINELEQRKALYRVDTQRLQSERDQLAQQAEIDVANIKQLQEELKQRDAKYSVEIDALAAKYKESQARVLAAEQELELLNSTAVAMEVAAVEAPSIELFDPPVTLSRGAYVASVPEEMEQKEVIGRVMAPAGLVRFKVNESPVEIDQDGVFTHQVPIGGARTQVTMMALDRQGKRVSFEFDMSRRLDAKSSKPKKRKFIRGLGKYHALVIGNSNYANFPSLNTPARDAETVAALLKKEYGYKVKVLLDATRYDIMSALNEYRKKLNAKDNLLIYYAGHGEIDQVNSQGYWLPVDSEKDNTANWISTRGISEILNVMAAKHVMIVADSCYSGAMSRSAMARLQSGKTYEEWVKWFKKVAKMRTRMILSSGGEEPVNDGGGGDHSLFAQAFMKALRDNDHVIDGYNLYMRISEMTKQMIEDQNLELPQSPQYAPIKFTGHEAGEFLFQRT